MKLLAIGDFHGRFPKKFEQIIKKEKIELVVSVGDHSGVEEWTPYFTAFFRKLKETGERMSAEEYFGKNKVKRLEKMDFENGKKVLRSLNEIGKMIPVVFIVGNWDSDWYKYPFDRKVQRGRRHLGFLKRQKNLVDINYRTRDVLGYKFLGFGGYMDTDVMVRGQSFDSLEARRNRRKRRTKSEKKLNFMLKNIGKKDKSIFVFHYAPRGVFDVIKDRKNPFYGENTGISIFVDAIKKKKPIFALCGHMHEYQGMKKLHGVPVINPGDAGRGRGAIITLPENKKEKLKVKFIN